MFCEKAVPRPRSFFILEISSFEILSTSVDYCTPNLLVGTNQSEISNFGAITNIKAMFCEKAVPRLRSFPISDISSLKILLNSVDYCTPNPLVGTNQSEISNLRPITNITAMFCEKAVPRQRSFPISDISSFKILSTSVDDCTPNPLVGTNQSEISNFGPITNITAMFCEKAVPRQRSFPISDISSFGIL